MVKTVSAAKVTMAEAVDVMVGADKSELVLELNERDDSADPIPRGVIDVAVWATDEEEVKSQTDGFRRSKL